MFTVQELVLTHNVNGMANIAKVDHTRKSVEVKRLPSDSPELQFLLQRGDLRECYSEVCPDGDVWVLRVAKRGWVVVSVDGTVRHTVDSKRLETDDGAFLTSFVAIPLWSKRSMVFVAKLLHAGYTVNLRDYIKVVGKLPPEVARGLKHMTDRGQEPSAYVEDVVRIEMWGHTLNRLYGSNMELLDTVYLSTLNWLPPLVCSDAILWRGMTGIHGKTLYVYLKGDSVLYVGYETITEAQFNRYTQVWREAGEVLTYSNLITPACAGVLEVVGEYKMLACRAVVCSEELQDEAQRSFIRFMLDCTVLIDEQWERTPLSVHIHKSWLYDLVNDKIYVFKGYDTDYLGHYYGEMTVDEWREKNDIEVQRRATKFVSWKEGGQS